MKRTFLIVLGFTAMVSASLAFTKDDPLYKNLKILPKNITKDQMDSVMHHFSDALNVRCNFCHVRIDSTRKMDFASDDNKHKLVAREMMTLTNEINDKYFDYTGGQRAITTQLMVTCFTCHHGAKEPEVNPPKKENRPPQDTARRL